jgi:hypothetical protein
LLHCQGRQSATHSRSPVPFSQADRGLTWPLPRVAGAVACMSNICKSSPHVLPSPLPVTMDG